MIHGDDLPIAPEELKQDKDVDVNRVDRQSQALAD
jgi:hypothetical protein